MPATDTLITLAGGLNIHESVALWMCEAGFRQLKFAADNGELLVYPRSAITHEDDQYIRAHKDELLAAVTHWDRMATTPF